MKKGVLSIAILVAAGVLVAASMVFAKFLTLDLGRSSKESANVTIVQTARISGGPTLQSGKYKVVLNSNSPTPEIGFYQNDKLVAQVPTKLVDEDKKFDKTEVYYNTRSGNTHVITEMDLNGWREEVLFGKNSGRARSAK